MKVIIFGNANISDYAKIKKYSNDADFIICCDGGIRHTYNMKITPNIIIGDFDSADKELIDYYKEMNVSFLRYPIRKDATDMEICLDYSIESGASEVVVLGGLGSRLDHSMANIFLLEKGISQKVKITIADEKNSIQMIAKEAEIIGEIGDIISLIPVTNQAVGVLTKGLEYPLVHEILHRESSRGVSNKLCLAKASVEIDSGLLLVIRSQD